jgi:hypothetical protein
MGPHGSGSYLNVGFGISCVEPSSLLGTRESGNLVVSCYLTEVVVSGWAWFRNFLLVMLNLRFLLPERVIVYEDVE